MRLPLVVLSLTAAVAAVAPAADAAPKKKPAPVCRVSFTDARADTVFGPAPSTETYDIVGGDIVNRPKEFVATLRLAAAPSTSGSEPASWLIATGASGVPVEFALRRAAGGGLTSAVTAAGQTMNHKFVIGQGTITWTAQKINSPLARPGVTFTSPNAATKLAALTADAGSATASKKCS